MNCTGKLKEKKKSHATVQWNGCPFETFRQMSHMQCHSFTTSSVSFHLNAYVTRCEPLFKTAVLKEMYGTGTNSLISTVLKPRSAKLLETVPWSVTQSIVLQNTKVIQSQMTVISHNTEGNKNSKDFLKSQSANLWHNFYTQTTVEKVIKCLHIKTLLLFCSLNLL